MNILFVASEVGSVRVLLPLIQECFSREIPYKVIKNGFFNELNDQYLTESYIEPIENESASKDFLRRSNISKVVFSVNLIDPFPLSIARLASELNIPTIHVLDFWHMYKNRMSLDGLEAFSPSAYIVPDEVAYKEALNEGIEEKLIHALGHPAYSNLSDEYNNFKNNPSKYTSEIFKKIGNRKLLLFISEPVADDQNDTRGYTEKDSLRVLTEAFSQNIFNKEFYICVMPHPREDSDNLNNIWLENQKEILGHVETRATSSELLPFARGIIGMTSTFLYQAWLMKTPILSIRPNDKFKSGSHLKSREGITSIIKENESINILSKWISDLDHNFVNTVKTSRVDLSYHEKSNQRVIDFIENTNNMSNL